jgi:lipoyl(octanoyl) transferase
MTVMVKNQVKVSDLGTIDYLTAWKLQKEIADCVADGSESNRLLLLQHPSVYTAGRRTLDTDRPSDKTPVIDVDRGGKITWHGLGQLVGYPIIKLLNPTDVVGFVRHIETALIDVCAELGVQTVRYCERSGVWIRDAAGDRKIAAIGIRVAKGVTTHGFSLNVNPDLSAYDQIIPCGISDASVTSLSKELQKEILVEQVQPIVEKHILLALEKVS